MKTKNTGIYILGVLVVVGGLFFFLRKPSAPEPEVPPATTTEIGFVTDEVKKREIRDSGEGYSIEVFYPETKSTAVTRYMEEYVQHAIAQFKTDSAWVNDPALPENERSVQATLSIDYTGSASEKVQNYIFHVASDTGGAHGITTTTTFSFLKTGDYLTLKTIFTDETKGLAALSRFAIDTITKRNISDEDWIKDGAGPEAQNYRSFSIGDNGITVYFDPYQVAAYASGPQEVVVPFSALKGLLVPALIDQSSAR